MIDWSNIIVALISGLCTAIPSIMSVRYANKQHNEALQEQAKKIQAQTDLINYRMDKLEQEVNYHNQVVRRMEVVEDHVKSADKRLDEMERKKS
jgi:predicted nuclease with TOPRIM domain